MLEEVPGQLTDFFKRKNIEPKGHTEEQRDNMLHILAQTPIRSKDSKLSKMSSSVQGGEEDEEEDFF